MSQQMFSLLNGDDTAASLYSGELVINEGSAVNSQDFTLMASRSFAEEVVFCARRRASQWHAQRHGRAAR